MSIFNRKRKESSINVLNTTDQVSNIKNEDNLMQEVISEFSTNKAKMILNIKRSEQEKQAFMKDARAYLEKYYPEYSHLFDATMKLVENYVFGYFRLTPLIEDPSISDIKVVDYNNIRIKRKGIRSGCDIRFKDEKEYKNFVNYVATKNQVNISNINASQRFSDSISIPEYILRFGISMPIITSSNNPYLHIRKIPRDFPLIDDLVKDEMIPEDLKEYVIERFNSASSLICGPSASGKTTFLNAIKETIPHKASVLVVQESEELTSKNHPDMMFEHPVLGNGDSKVQYTLYDIIASALIMDIERFIIGEIKGAEALHLLNASYTGHICSATIHSESSITALDKLADYAKYKSDYSKIEMMKMLTSFKTIFFIKDYKIQEITEIMGWDEEKQSPIYIKKYERK